MFVTVPFEKGVTNVVIDVKLINACPVLKVVKFQYSWLTWSWTTKQHPPDVTDGEEEVVFDVEDADVVLEKKEKLVADLKLGV